MMVQKIGCFGSILVVFSMLLSVQAYSIEVNAKGAVLMDAQSGRVLFAQNERERMPMASTTKIMSALLTLEQENLDEYFTVDADAIRVEGSSMGLVPDDSVTLRVLAAGMLLASGNDAANAAAVHIAGSRQLFVEMMNKRAEELGMEGTSFETPSGLDGDEHYSTAYDMALLAQAALKNEAFAEICSQYRMTLEYGNPPFKRWMRNHNRLLDDYKGAIGVKTGFTKKAGRCLVSAAERDGVTLIAVTLGCPDDWRMHTKMLDYGFEQLKSTDLSALLPPLEIAVGGGVSSSVGLAPQGGLTAALAEGEQVRVQAKIGMNRFVLAPVKKGAAVGEVVLTLDGRELRRIPLCATEDVAARPVAEKQKGLLERIKNFFQR
ncbi:D-alanyl-D-alanine carboxypeptidase family protein [Hydrogenoanaerobacterium sp.]|uniref:D-alanyl-D-alanine carboxypeptidase family protein n=1 Tax=Hydrogenoanaerobacterium sp. TaxID=2953763 RepID=UPI0028992383|nr:D-alanyl-D-alanine carboxypeptidase family protein [Hydrogenoanaerobacterium sp.]